jgi:copper chaperone CopZ
MTPEKRLDQLEPVVAEVLAQLDRVTAQNRSLAIATHQNTQAIISQSDNIQFLLREVAEVKAQVTEVKAEVAEIKVNAAAFETKIIQRFDSQDAKMDLILKILQSGNGRH